MSLFDALRNGYNAFTSSLARVNVYDLPTYGNAPATQVVWINDNLGEYVGQGYAANDIVYSICQITSEKIKVAPWNVYQVKDERALKMMVSLQKEFKPENHKRILDLKTKALELYTGDSRLNELLKYPNEHETFQDIAAHSSISKMLTGNRFLEGRLLEMGANQGKPSSLELLPSQIVTIVATRSYPIRVVSYLVNINGANDIPITKEAMLHDKYYNPTMDISGSHLYGMAPLKAARMTLTNDNSATEAATKSFQNMGPGTVMFINDDRLTGAQAVEQANAVKQKWMEEYSGAKNSRKMPVSGYKLDKLDLGLSPVDLAIIDQQKWNLVRFCNIWNFPHIMLLADHATDNNVGWAERALTSRCCLPLLTSFRDSFNRKLHTDWGYKNENIYIDYDQSVYPELDVNRKEASEWIDKSWELTIRQRYELKNIEIPKAVEDQYGDLLDKILVKDEMMELNEAVMGDMEGDLDSELSKLGLNGNSRIKPTRVAGAANT